MAWRPGRGRYGEHSFETVEHIEKHNCSKGCVRGARTRAQWDEFGPGGTCGVLAAVSVAVDVVPELDDDGEKLTCSAFEAKPAPAPRKRKPRPDPPGQLTIGEF